MEYMDGDDEFDDRHQAMAYRFQYNPWRYDVVNQDSLSFVYRIND